MKYIFLFTFLLGSLISNAQELKLDSLKSSIVEFTNDTAKIDVYYRINRMYYHVNVDSGLKYALLGLNLSCELDLPSKMVQGYYVAGAAYQILGNIGACDSMAELCLEASIRSKDKSNIMKAYYNLAINANRQKRPEVLPSYLKSFEIAQEIGDVRWSAYILRDIGLYYLSLAEYDVELDYLFKAEKLFRQLNDTSYLIYTYCDIAEVHRLQKNFNTGLEYCQKAQQYSEPFNNPYMNAVVLTAKATIYTDMGELEMALKYMLQGLLLYQEINSFSNVGTTSVDIGNIYFKLKKYDLARKYLNDSYTTFKKMELDDYRILSLLGLGKLNLEQGHLNEAQIVYSEAEGLAIKLGLLPQLKDTYEALANLYEVENNHKKSNEYLNLLISVKDSIYNEQKSQQINRLETEYQVKEKENHIELQETQLELQESTLQKRQNLNYAIGIIALLLLLIAILTSVNIQKRKRLNQQLKDLDLAKNRFFSNISHEMRNPLTLIMSPLQKLSEKSKNTPLYSDLQLAYNNSKKLLDRVNEILDLSKLEAGKMELNESPVVLHDFCRRILFSYQSLAHYRKIKLDFNFLIEKETTVLLDNEKVEKIINNLILNAFKHSETKGSIGLVVKSESKQLLICVKDTGKGIAANDLPYIFDRYYQANAEDTSKPTQGGTGIGLTLVREYARLSGGDITVESSPGHGTEFILQLPFKLASIPLAAEENSIPEKVFSETEKSNWIHPTNGQKPKILIVEDDLEMSKYVADCLSDKYLCTTAPDGLEALELLNNNSFDLIISDVMMPKMDGFTFREKFGQI